MEAGISATRQSPFRTPQEREEYRKSLHKSTPSSWRVAYKKVNEPVNFYIPSTLKIHIKLLLCVFYSVVKRDYRRVVKSY